MTITRREALKGAAWSVPVIAASIATPMAAASEPAGAAELRFHGASAHKGKTPGSAYIKVRLKNDSSYSASNVLITLMIRQDGITRTEDFAIPFMGGNETHPLKDGHYEFEVTGLNQKGGDIFFSATAMADNGVTAIPFTDTMEAKKLK